MLHVVTSCTGSKSVIHKDQLSHDDFVDVARRASREAELVHLHKPAAEMYTGEQHLGVMRGIREIRERLGSEAVSLSILSAGYGLIEENTPVAPYEMTFQSMSRAQARAWAEHLRLAETVRGRVAHSPVVIFLLGDSYLRPIKPPLTSRPGQRFIFLAKPTAAASLRAPGTTVVPAGREQTRYGAGYVALKGRMFELFARHLAKRGPDLIEQLRRDDTSTTFLKAVEAELP